MIRGRGGLPPSSVVPGGLQASWGEVGWLDFLNEGLASFINLGSSGGAGGGTEEGKDGGGGSTGAGEPRRGLRAVGGGGKPASGG